MISCTFTGHRDAYEPIIESKVRAHLFRLMELDTAFCFYSGGMNRFDLMCERLVLPYMKNSITTHSAYYSKYDEIILPSGLETCPCKAAILRRNRWMIDRSDYLIAYIHHSLGGAYATLKYARRRSITIWNVAEPPAVGLNAYPKIWE